MDILLSLNFLAITGTSFLMMAVATIWFSPSFFGGPWLRSIGKTETDIPQQNIMGLFISLASTFLCHMVLVSALACLVSVAPILSITPIVLSGAVCAFALALIALPVIWEGRALSYFAVLAGYAVLFIFGSTIVLQYWPW